MRLRAVKPPLPPALIDALDECSIKTDADLMFSGTPIEIYAKIAPCEFSLGELTRYIKQITKAASATAVRGHDLLKEEEQRYAEHDPADCTCGVPELDALLARLGSYRVTEISGDHGTSKSLLALQIVLRHLADNPASGVLWIDTTGDFNTDKIPGILRKFEDMPGAATAALRLQVTIAFDVDGIYNAFQELQTSIDSHDSTTRFIVIDSVTPIFRPLLSAVSAQGHATMTTFMRQLRALAQTYCISVLVINGTSGTTHEGGSSSTSRARKPALGPSFTYLTDSTLWLSRSTAEVAGPHGYTAEITRSRVTASGQPCRFVIKDGVIRSYQHPDAS